MSKKTKILVISVIVVLAISIWAVIHFNVFTNTKVTQQTGSSKQAPKQSSTQPNQSTQTQSTTTSPSTSTYTTTSTSAKSNGNTQNSTTLLTPYGQFVSNQNPSISDPNQQTEVSICETTPGASCYIEFLNNNGASAPSLKEQTTDSNGVTSWTWTLNQEGLTIGTWQVKAVTVLGNQTQTATETMTVQQ